ncbi:MAG: hypothetical protein QNJ53_21910 [Pleurocapsa sp. MO_192.B19]|nr:hypothetical protein [Pleurocapsa sp. MO_192.B19]
MDDIIHTKFNFRARSLDGLFIVDSQNNEYWIWLAIDRATREIVGYFIGDRFKVF